MIRAIGSILGRMVVALVAVGGVASLASMLMGRVNRAVSFTDHPVVGLVAMLFIIAASVGAYVLVVRFMEKRRVAELEPDRAPGELGAGLAVGGALFAATALLIAISGGLSVEGASVAWNPLIGALSTALLAGFVEEIIARGIVFRYLEEILGSLWALLLSAAIFGALHLGNPNATWLAALAIACSAGLVLGAAFVATRGLWLPIGIHTGWNFTQGGIFGGAVSGNPTEGILKTQLAGPEWITGGAFGAEGSIFIIVLGLLLAGLLYRRAARTGALRAPRWR